MLRSSIISLFLSLIVSIANAQYTLRVTVMATPELHREDDLYIAGSFNGWDPGNEKYVLARIKDSWVIEIPNLSPDAYEFKFTRGSWPKVEGTNGGGDLNNRLIKLSSDTSIFLSIASWRDDFAQQPRQHTITANARVLDTAFTMPALGTKRRLWIYLPEGYEQGSKRYPVIYMHDGQNLFDSYTSGFGEWGVDEVIDSLTRKGKPAAIVVGIDNGPERINEYNPYDHPKFGTGKGDKYLDDLVRSIKPYIDKRFRTLSSNENTIIAGSSMGGLISYYAMLKQPGVFGKAGIFSPAFWTAPAIPGLTDSLGVKVNGKFFFYAGALEGGNMEKDMEEVMERLGANSSAMIYSVIDPEGRHNEVAWRKWFAEFYNWIMADGYNNVIRMND